MGFDSFMITAYTDALSVIPVDDTLINIKLILHIYLWSELEFPSLNSNANTVLMAHSTIAKAILVRLVRAFVPPLLPTPVIASLRQVIPSMVNLTVDPLQV